MPHLADGCESDWWGGPSDARVPDAADVQRRSELRRCGNLGLNGHLGGRQGHALGAVVVLGTRTSAIQGADIVWTSDARRGGGEQGRREKRQARADAGLDVPRYGYG